MSFFVAVTIFFTTFAAILNTKDKMKRILIAEDNDSNFLLMTYVLREHYEVLRAVNGRDAVMMTENQPRGFGADGHEDALYQRPGSYATD